MLEWSSEADPMVAPDRMGHILVRTGGGRSSQAQPSDPGADATLGRWAGGWVGVGLFQMRAQA